VIGITIKKINRRNIMSTKWKIEMENKTRVIVNEYHKEYSYYEMEYRNRINDLKKKYKEKIFDHCESYADAITFEDIDNCIYRHVKDLEN